MHKLEDLLKKPTSEVEAFIKGLNDKYEAQISMNDDAVTLGEAFFFKGRPYSITNTIALVCYNLGKHYIRHEDLEKGIHYYEEAYRHASAPPTLVERILIHYAQVLNGLLESSYFTSTEDIELNYSIARQFYCELLVQPQHAESAPMWLAYAQVLAGHYFHNHQQETMHKAFEALKYALDYYQPLLDLTKFAHPFVHTLTRLYSVAKDTLYLTVDESAFFTQNYTTFCGYAQGLPGMAEQLKALQEG